MQKRFKEEQIMSILKLQGNGMPVKEIIRQQNISEQTFYRWKKRYVEVGPQELRRLRQLEEENSKLKKLVAELSLDKSLLQEALVRKW
jgi:putative transposase